MQCLQFTDAVQNPLHRVDHHQEGTQRDEGVVDPVGDGQRGRDLTAGDLRGAAVPAADEDDDAEGDQAVVRLGDQRTDRLVGQFVFADPGARNDLPLRTAGRKRAG